MSPFPENREGMRERERDKQPADTSLNFAVSSSTQLGKLWTKLYHFPPEPTTSGWALFARCRKALRISSTLAERDTPADNQRQSFDSAPHFCGFWGCGPAAHSSPLWEPCHKSESWTPNHWQIQHIQHVVWCIGCCYCKQMKMSTCLPSKSSKTPKTSYRFNVIQRLE